MIKLPKNKILMFRPDALFEVRKDIGMEEPGKMEDAIKLLEDWIAKQAHFERKDFDRGFLERLVICAKGSMERAKSRLDKMCTIKTVMQDSFDVTDIRKDLAPTLSKITFAALPKSTENHERVYIYQLLTSNYNNDDLYGTFKYCTVVCEYMHRTEYSKKFIMIMDHLQTKNLLNLMTKVNPALFSNFVKILTEVYGLRLKYALLLTESQAAEKVVNFFKQFLSAKVSKRLITLRSYADLEQYVSKDILPADYGGEERSINELHEEWLDLLNLPENMANYNKIKEFKTNEAYRQTDKYNEAYMGMPGSFRTLRVD